MCDLSDDCTLMLVSNSLVGSHTDFKDIKRKLMR